MTTQYIIECFVGALNEAEMPVFYVTGESTFSVVRDNAKRFATLQEAQDFINVKVSNRIWGIGFHFMVRPVK